MTSALKTNRKPQDLNSRQRQFAINYASGMTLTEAYIKAGYSPIEAGTNASALFSQNQGVQACYNEVSKRKEDIALAAITETIMQPHEVKARLSELARANLVDFLDEDGKPKLSRTTPHHSAAKKYYKKSRTDRAGNPIETTEIALHDQIEALRELAKIHGMYAPQKHMVAKRVIVEMVDKRRGEVEE